MSTITLRHYQDEAATAVVEQIRAGLNPVCAVATGGGKSLIIAECIRRLGGRCLVTAHKQELLEQDAEAIRELIGIDAGIYSAGLGKRQASGQVVVGGIQSIFRNIDKLLTHGKFDHIFIDESHTVKPPSAKKSMYARILNACQGASISGYSATPYRLGYGPIYEGNDKCFDCLAYHIGITDLVELGWLVPLVGLQTASQVDLSSVGVMAGDYQKKSLSKALSEDVVVSKAVDEICELAEHRKAWLLFCIDKNHAAKVVDALRSNHIDVATVFDNTHKDERREIVSAFKAGELRSVVNVGIFTTGTDIPRVDCVGLMAATLSKGRVVQEIGRGARLSPETGKTDCLVLDLTGSMSQHLPLDGMPELKKSRAVREEEERQDLLKALERAVQAKKARRLHNAYADREFDPMGNGEVKHVQVGAETHTVRWIDYRVVRSAKRPSLNNLMVTYVLEGAAPVRIWLCPEYKAGSLPRQKAEEWFRRRGIEKIPFDAQACMDLAMMKRDATRVAFREENGFMVILSEEFGEREPIVRMA